jgi:hypothetical protein
VFFCFFTATGMVTEGSRVFFVSSQQRGIHKYFVSPKRDILPSRYMEFGKHKFGLYSLLSKRKFPLGFPRTGSCSVQRGQRGTLRQQSRTILSRLTERQGQSTAVRPVRVPPKHERALQPLLDRPGQQRTATPAAAPPVTVAGWEQPSLCTAETGFPVNDQTATSREKGAEKGGKTPIFWYTKFEDEQSSNTYPQGGGKTKEKVPRGSKSSKNLFLGVNQTQKPIYRPKSPEMSGSMYKWCFQGSSMCPKFFENPFRR